MMRWWFVQSVIRRSQNCCVGIKYVDTASKLKRGAARAEGEVDGVMLPSGT
jgi:hypothetical protein